MKLLYSISKLAAVVTLGMTAWAACAEPAHPSNEPPCGSGGCAGEGRSFGGSAGTTDAAGQGSLGSPTNAGDGGGVSDIPRGEGGEGGEGGEAGDFKPEVVDQKALAVNILADSDLATTKKLCADILSDGFNAGSGYPQVWIRDFNTFVEVLLDYNPAAPVREGLLRFFHFQGLDLVSYGGLSGNIADTCDDSMGGNPSKNTAETDQETSLIQAVRKYVDKTGDRAILNEIVDGETVSDRMGDALDYLLTNRFSEKYRLLWGATTADWGDNQPEDMPGASLDSLTHPAIDIYDNAMFILALRDYIALTGDPSGKWRRVMDEARTNARKYMWDGRKFVPHVYLDRGSPFSFQAFFDETTIFYHGGTAVAMEAGLLSQSEVGWSLRQMRADRLAAGAQTIGLNQYPPYPLHFFANPAQTAPYTYQNAGDWPWFGGRTIQQLIKFGFVKEAYDELRPMLKLFVRDNGISEWYTPGGAPQGSPKFKGAAGTVGKAISLLETWAKNVN